jgi:hypothetical protein
MLHQVIVAAICVCRPKTGHLDQLGNWLTLFEAIGVAGGGALGFLYAFRTRSEHSRLDLVAAFGSSITIAWGFLTLVCFGLVLVGALPV